MIQDRKYNISEEELNITFEEFSVKYDNKNLDIFIDDKTNNKKIYVHFYNDPKSFGKNDVLVPRNIILSILFLNGI